MDLAEIFNEIKWRSYYSILNWRFRLLDPSMASQVQPNPYVVLSEMKRAQWMKGQTLTERVFKKVKHIIEHAYRHVRYYNRLYKKLGLHPDRLSSLDDITKFPVVTKEDLRAAGDDVLADNVDRSRISHHVTSGSIGNPFSFYLDANWGLRRFASKWLLDSYFGARPQTRYFVIFSDLRLLKEGQLSGHSFKDKLEMTMKLVDPLQYHSIWYLDITEERIPKIMNELIKFKPKYGSTNPTMLPLLSEILSRRPAQMLKLKGIVLGVETLLEGERKRFEQTCGCSIFNRYGSREFYGAVAGECEYHSGLHVNLDLVLIEILDNNNEPCSTGEAGEIVITDFYNKSMPFIRYRIGDIGSLDSGCNCGRGFPMLGQVIGRASEWVVNKEGRKIPLHCFTTVVSLISEELSEPIREFQFRQTKAGYLVMRVVPNPTWNEPLVKERIVAIERRSGIDLDFEIVDQITPLPSGKRQLLVA